MTQSQNIIFIQIRKSDYLAAIHVAYFRDKNRESERHYAVSRDSIFAETLMSDVVTGGVYNETFSMTTLETTEEKRLHSQHLYRRQVPCRRSLRRMKIQEKFCGRIQCIGQIYCSRGCRR